MSVAVVTIPTDAALDAAWERYCVIARRIVDKPELLYDREHCTELAYAWADWRDLMVARRLM